MMSNIDCLMHALALKEAGDPEGAKWLKENPPLPWFPLDWGDGKAERDCENRRRLAEYAKMFEDFGL